MNCFPPSPLNTQYTFGFEWNYVHITFDHRLVSRQRHTENITQYKKIFIKNCVCPLTHFIPIKSEHHNCPAQSGM